MQNTTFIHVGFPRTGTSTLQRAVFPHLHGVWYPQQDKRHEFAGTLRQIAAFEPLLLDMDQLRSHFKPVYEQSSLLSYERLVGDLQDNFSGHFGIRQTLKTLFPNAKIILTIRRQDKFLQSVYHGFLGRGGYQSLSEFLGSEGAEFRHTGKYLTKFEGLGSVPVLDVGSVSFYRFYRSYVEVFGADNVLVLPLELMTGDWPSYAHLLETFTGVQLPDWDKTPGKKRKTITRYGAPGVRLINRFARTDKNPFGFIPVKKTPHNPLSRLNIRALHNLVGNIGNAPILDEATADKIMALHRAENKLLEQHTGLDLGRFGYT